MFGTDLLPKTWAPEVVALETTFHHRSYFNNLSLRKKVKRAKNVLITLMFDLKSKNSLRQIRRIQLVSSVSHTNVPQPIVIQIIEADVMEHESAFLLNPNGKSIKEPLKHSPLYLKLKKCSLMLVLVTLLSLLDKQPLKMLDS